MRLHPVPTNLFVALALALAHRPHTTVTVSTSAALTLRLEFRDKPRDGNLADFSRGWRAPVPLSHHVVLLAAGLLRRSGASAPAFLRGRLCAIKIALALELREVCVEHECPVRCMSQERDFCWWAEVEGAKKDAQVHCEACRFLQRERKMRWDAPSLMTWPLMRMNARMI